MRTRLFRLVLRLCPRDFRDRFGEDVLHTAAELDRDRPARLVDAPRLALDAIRTWRAIRRETRMEARGGTGRARSWRSRAGTRLWAIIADVARAARALGRAPRFALTTIGVFASGIGVTTAVFAVFATVALPRLAVRDPDGLRFITATPQLVGDASYDDWNAVERLDGIFSGVAFSVPDRSLLWTGVRNVSVGGESVSGNYFAVLGVPLVRGRGLAQDDARPDSAAVVVIGESLWHRAFHDDPAIVGRIVHLPVQWPWPAADGGEAFTVIGVADGAFRGAQGGWSGTDYWVTFPARARDYRCVNPPYLTHTGGNLVARLRHGVSDREASAALTALADQRRSLHSGDPHWTLALGTAPKLILPFRILTAAGQQRFLWGVFALAGVLFAIVMFNLAGMLLARGLGRQAQIAVRLMLGASRARVVWETFSEALLIAAGGAGLGLGFAHLIADALMASVPVATSAHTAPHQMSVTTPLFDWRVLAFAGALCVIGAVVSGLVPALRLSRPSLAMGAPAGVSSSFSGGVRGGSRVRLWIVVPQLALSLALLVVAAVLVRALFAAAFLDRRYDASHVSYVSFDLPHPSECSDDATLYAQYTAIRTRFYDRVSAALVRRPDVESFGLTLFLPWEPQNGLNVLSREGYASLTQPRFIHSANWSPGVRSALHVPLLAGRDFDDHDADRSEPVAMVNESLARLLWPRASALGHFLGMAGAEGREPRWNEVVGVVADIWHNETGPQPMMYEPVAQHDHYAMALLARTKDEAPASADALAAIVHDADPSAAIFHADTADSALRALSDGQRFSAILLATGGCGGLLLAMLGLYGVVSYAVTQRTREIGIRHALGAGRADILGLFVRDGLLASAIGMALGVAMGLETLHAARSVVYGAPSADVASCTLVTVALGATVCLACLIPARRAMRVDPVDALRTL